MAGDDEPRDPSLATLLQAWREVILDAVHVMLPGRIVDYDATKQLATVQPMIKQRHVEEDGVTLTAETLPAVHNCPVVFCGTSRGRITWPVAAGDTCEIRFASASIARWVLQGGGPVDPGDDRRHDLSDAICMVGLHDAAHVPTDAPTDAICLTVSGGTLIKLGGSSASSAVVVQTALGDFMTALGNAITALGASPAAPALAALQTALNALNTGTGWKAGTSSVVAK